MGISFSRKVAYLSCLFPLLDCPSSGVVFAEIEVGGGGSPAGGDSSIVNDPSAIFTPLMRISTLYEPGVQLPGFSHPCPTDNSAVSQADATLTSCLYLPHIVPSGL